MEDRSSLMTRRIRAVYEQEQRNEDLHGNWAMTVLCRPLGFRVAALAMRYDMTPTQITYISVLLSILIPFLAWYLGVLAGACAVAFVGWFVQVLDCADGDLARATGQETKHGADFDMLGDILFFALLYVSIGILSAVQTDNTLWLVLAMAAGWLRLYARTIRDRCNDVPPAHIMPPSGFTEKLVAAAQGIDGLLPFLAVGAIMGPWPVLVLLAVSLADISLTIHPLLQRTN